MIKKTMIICMCVMAIIAVFGLQDRLTYNGFQTASEMITGNVENFEDDWKTIEVITDAIELFDITRSFEVTSGVNINGEWSRLTFRWTEFDLEAENPTETYKTVTKDYFFNNPEMGPKLERILSPLEWGEEYTGIFEEIIDVLQQGVFYLGVGISFLMLILLFLFDAVGMALSVVKAGLYLLGF